LNKVTSHIKEWKKGNKTLLCLSNLDSYRNIIDATDVTSAIHVIVAQEKGDNYLICNDQSHLVYDLVRQLYRIGGIEVEEIKNGLKEKNSDLPVLIIKEKHLGFDSTPTNIKGEAKKLKKLGWKPIIKADNILLSLIQE
jgi:GDPmannose 4,6-dehydratase